MKLTLTQQTRQALITTGWTPSAKQLSRKLTRFEHPEKTYQTAGGDPRPLPLYLFLGSHGALRAGPTTTKSRSITGSRYHQRLMAGGHPET